ncbi:Nicotinate phosphoribosyltransferase [Fasciola gigantica]|uniref:Nicotinate phosphoribosyltransferase n=1 Tax=Fasciola gigantica TaxID=46835 RepID=A0A504Y2R5_FASGI|nr:Nicotinate phosphoribosyltransferase [Fasciola gigantica]
MTHCGVVQPLLTDFYQLTMSYGYWKAGKAEEQAVFEIFFRKNPFQGEFTIFAGLSDCIEYLNTFKFTEEDIHYLKSVMPGTVDPAFFVYLLHLPTDGLSLWAADEGSVVFPKEPIVRVEGPVIVCQLLETTLLNLVNFASLMATNAARFRLAAGTDKQLYEFGLRRAQGPDGGLTASRYAYLGGYDGTSNVLAGKLFGIPVVGTHAHSFVSVYQEKTASVFMNGALNDHSDLKVPSVPDPVSEIDIDSSELLDLHGESMELDRFLQRCWYWSRYLGTVLDYVPDQVHAGELAAFANYAYAFPANFVGLIDTYDVLRSGLPNFCSVSLALHEYGYQALGLRIDSGDLAFLSLMVRDAFKRIAKHFNLPWFEKVRILVSNDLNEDTLFSLNQQAVSVEPYGKCHKGSNTTIRLS